MQVLKRERLIHYTGINDMRKRLFSIICIISVLFLSSVISFNLNIKTVKAQEQFIDDFNTANLDSKWAFTDPDGGSTYNLSVNPGWLRITTTSPPGRDLYANVQNAPHILQSGISENFTLETKINATTLDQDEGGGLLVWNNFHSHLRFERLSRLTEQQILLTVEGGDFAIVTLSSNLNSTYLRLVKSGQSYSGYYSSDGTTWNLVGVVAYLVNNPLSVGLDIIQMYHSGIFFADFDYFNLTLTSQPFPTASPTLAPTLTPTASPSSSAIQTSSPIPTPTSTPLLTSRPQITVNPTVTLPPPFNPNWFNMNSIIWLLIIIVPISVVGLWIQLKKTKFSKNKTKIIDLIEKKGRISLKEASEATGIKMTKIKRTLIDITEENPIVQGFFIDNDQEFINKTTIASLLNALGKFSFEEVAKKFNITTKEAKEAVTNLFVNEKIKGTFTSNEDGFITEDRLLSEIGKE
jgi:hypothetical protein